MCDHKYPNGESAIKYDSTYEMRSSEMHCKLCNEYGTRQELEKGNKELGEVTYHE